MWLDQKWSELDKQSAHLPIKWLQHKTLQSIHEQFYVENYTAYATGPPKKTIVYHSTYFNVYNTYI
jgi:hypothetical protein